MQPEETKASATQSTVDTSTPKEPDLVKGKLPADGAANALLQMEPPTSSETSGSNGDEHKGVHLTMPPYVHHFDTYSLVKDVEKGGFTQDQSVTLMKAVRNLLAINLDVAKEGMVSKSDIENVRLLSLVAMNRKGY